MSPEGKNSNPWRLVGAVLSIVFLLPVAATLGGLLGWWLDGKLGTRPVLTLALLFLGFLAGLREVVRELKRLSPW